MLFARIARSSHPITITEWNNIIATHYAFDPIPDRVGVNPFTKEDVLFSGAGKAFYVVDGQRAGNASLDNGEILITGVPRSVCDEVASRLRADVFEDDRS